VNEHSQTDSLDGNGGPEDSPSGKTGNGHTGDPLGSPPVERSVKRTRRYSVTAFLLVAVGAPVASGILLFIALVAGVTTPPPVGVFVVALVPTLGIFMLAFIGKPPASLFKRFLPLVLTYGYYLLVWVVVFGASGYHYSQIGPLYLVPTMPYLLHNAYLSMSGAYLLFPLMQTFSLAGTLAAVQIAALLKKRKGVFNRRLAIAGAAVVLLCGVAGFQAYEHSVRFYTPDPTVERVGSEVDLYQYHPFAPDNSLTRLAQEPSLTFRKDYPRLDGATAAYPVYAAIAQELYQGLDEQSVESYVTCSNTSNAYDRLIYGEIDLFFGAQPSKEQQAFALEQGITLEQTPLGREAFVFFVNKDNPVDSLTLEQIQDIYQKKITNWKQVGGNDEPILAFQRPEGSGSQTIMLAKVMAGLTLPEPLQEESVSGMGGIIEGVAEYRNHSSAIGYSFRQYATGMKSNSSIKLLAIDGTEPSVGNIRNGTYPLSIDFYAVSAGPRSENTQKLVDWCLSEQGQGFIETCGYVGLKQGVE
jgi:phosphate transport system substrate-binding protein